MACRLESIAELMCVTLISVVVFFAIRARVTLVRFGFSRSSRVGFLGGLLLVVELIDLMRASIESFAIRGEVRGTRKLKQTTANINSSKRILVWKVVNNIIHGSRKRHETVACCCSIGL